MLLKNHKKTIEDRSHYLFTNTDLKNLILPLVIEQLLAILVGMADAMMIANVGEDAVSGVSLVDQIMVLLINVFAALATGGAVVAGQYLGIRNKQKAKEAANQLVWFITVSALVITIIVYIGKDWILSGVFGQITPEVRYNANIYLLIVTASVPFMALYNGGAAIFRVMGNSKITMKVSIIMNIINVAGNAILIFGFHRGAEGVAIPTLLSRVVAAVLIIYLLMDKKQDLHIEKTLRYRPQWGLIKKILSIGVPNGLENSMFQLGKIIILSLVSTFGTYAIAANAVSNSLALFQIIPGLAIGMAVTTVISRCVGAGDYEQVQYYHRKLLKINYICMSTANILIILALPFILKLYNLTDVTAETAWRLSMIHGSMAIFIWPLSFSLPNTFRAAGDARVCMGISIFSMWLFRIVFSYILGKYMGFGIEGVWVAMIIDWIFRSICFSWRYFSGKWKKSAIV